VAWAIRQAHPDQELEYVEVVSSIASRSAGPATRLNIDEYVETTEKALMKFSGSRKAKAILILNPAQPCINMQTTVFATVRSPDLDRVRQRINEVVSFIQAYVPGYQLVLPPMYENGRVAATVRVQGLGDYLPRFAGNLDIINCAGIAIAEAFARRGLGRPSGAGPQSGEAERNPHA
jgi:acetaldehyde dehydrogenase